MGNRTTGAERIRRADARDAWLHDHPDLLKRLPSTNDDVTVDGRKALLHVFRVFVREGLYSPGSGAESCMWGMRTTVSRIRGERCDDYRRRWLRR